MGEARLLLASPAPQAGRARHSLGGGGGPGDGQPAAGTWGPVDQAAASRGRDREPTNNAGCFILAASSPPRAMKTLAPTVRRCNEEDDA
ncbi:hypothetical protein E2562_032100 [Oryza meyeriana var. granulata]|uniref:Uncharacterized protein n=1 Tax=Oryza meyeriana var. granulata TaxID=110450 RepID=A0A6G1CLI7_9ORYZ|nr:hypothetical protein E2562_032100 [Oryza meyeriana var. granulata]